MARRAPILIMVLALSSPAFAGDPPEVMAARAAYDRGVALFDAKDYAGAARAFAEADATVRNDVALGAAIDAAIRADDPVLGMGLVDRAEGRPIANVAEARAKFSKRIGRVRVTCSGCTATLDGAPLTIGSARVVALGDHALLLEQNGKRDARTVSITPGQTIEIAWAPPIDKPPIEKTASGVSPVWFWVSAGTTAAFGAVTTVSALSVRDTREDFDALGCARVEKSGCRELADRGEGQQRLTNILLGVTIVSATTTTILGVYGVRWSVARTDDGAVASIKLRF